MAPLGVPFRIDGRHAVADGAHEPSRPAASLAGFGRDRARADELATQEALRDSEERLRLVRRATGLGMYEIDWVARRRYWSPELREILRVPDDLDINTDTDLLERIIPDEMRARFREKMQASLAPESGGDYEDEHRITRFDGSTGWILLRGKTFFAEGPNGRRPTRSIGLVVDITDRKRGEEANALHASTVLLVERRDLLDRSRPHDPHLESAAQSASTDTPLRKRSAARSQMICPDHLHDEQLSLYADTTGGKPVVLETVRRHKDGRLIPVGISAARRSSRRRPGRGRRGGAPRHDREPRHYKEHLGFTLRELSHRTKNLLAVVQGLAHMIARRSDEHREFETRLRGCIQALAYRTISWCSTTGRARRWRNCCASSLRRSAGIDTGRIVAHGPEVFLHAAGDAVARADHARARHQRDQAWRAVGQAGTVAVDWTARSGGISGVTWTGRSGGPPVAAADAQGLRSGGVRADRRLRSTAQSRPNSARRDWCAPITIAASNLLPAE